ncbi:hypothetical protein [Sphingomonas sp.]|uniref:hypothetical protein n=1 Tax=Sphingomonas sp. TaxID=28214 RepID=UPI003B00A4CD
MPSRPINLLLGMLLTVVGVSRPSSAAELPLRFYLDSREGEQVQLRLTRDEARDRRDFSSNYAPRDLGLASAALAPPGPSPVSFALGAAAGRIDCSGTARVGHASGSCTFRPSPRFADLLQRHGYASPSLDEGLTLTALRFDPEVLDALDAACFPRGTTGELAALAVFHIDGREVRSLTAAGGRPEGLDKLVRMHVLGVTPGFIAGFTNAGYRNLPAEQLIQYKLFNITPEFVRTAESRAGRRLSTNEIVQQRIQGPRR